jgi:hypothetical protein
LAGFSIVRSPVCSFFECKKAWCANDAAWQVHASILGKLRERLLQRVPSLSTAQLEHMLAKTFAFITVPEVCAVPKALLRRHPEIPREYLEQLVEQPALVDSCDLHVRRQAWVLTPRLYMRALAPHFQDYTTAAEEAMQTLTLSGMRAVAATDSRQTKARGVWESIGKEKQSVHACVCVCMCVCVCVCVCVCD